MTTLEQDRARAMRHVIHEYANFVVLEEISELPTIEIESVDYVCVDLVR